MRGGREGGRERVDNHHSRDAAHKHPTVPLLIVLYRSHHIQQNKINQHTLALLTLGTHAQRGLLYLVCVSMCVCVCVSVCVCVCVCVCVDDYSRTIGYKRTIE